MSVYQTPRRPRTPAYMAAMSWWRRLAIRRRAECADLRRNHGLTSCARIAAYHAQWVR